MVQITFFIKINLFFWIGQTRLSRKVNNKEQTFFKIKSKYQLSKNRIYTISKKNKKNIILTNLITNG